MKRVSVSRRKPPLSCLPPKCATSNIASQVIPVATAIAINEVSGNVIRVCATESVMTPVMVPGLAAKRISGVSDCFDLESPAAGCPLSMENPIHANTPPPATIKASSDTPNRFNNCCPRRAATVRMIRTAQAAFAESVIFSLSDCPATARANIAAQIAGLISDSTVMMA